MSHERGASWIAAGVERAAILLLALGEQDAAQVLKHLGAKDVQRVGAAMAQLIGVSREEVSTVLTTFSSNVEQQTSFGVGTDDYIRKVLIEALGADKAGSVIDRILRRPQQPRTGGAQVDGAARGRATCCATSTRRSSPSCCPTWNPDQAAEVLTQLPEKHARRHPDAHRHARWRASDGARRARRGAREAVLRQRRRARAPAASAARKRRPRSSTWWAARRKARIMAQIAKVDEPLSQKLQDLMFVFEDLNEVDDRGMQELLREVPGDKLIIALKAADEKLKQKILQEHVGARRADDEGRSGSARARCGCRKSRRRRRKSWSPRASMAEEGRLQLGGKGGEEYV